MAVHSIRIGGAGDSAADLEVAADSEPGRIELRIADVWTVVEMADLVAALQLIRVSNTQRIVTEERPRAAA